jgi:hypothetical protein
MDGWMDGLIRTVKRSTLSCCRIVSVDSGNIERSGPCDEKG